MHLTHLRYNYLYINIYHYSSSRLSHRTTFRLRPLASVNIILIHDVYFFEILINYLCREKRPVVYVPYMTCQLLFRIKPTLTFSIGKSMAKILRSRDDDGTR